MECIIFSGLSVTWKGLYITARNDYSGMESARHTGHCPINPVNVW